MGLHPDLPRGLSGPLFAGIACAECTVIVNAPNHAIFLGLVLVKAYFFPTFFGEETTG